MPPIVCIVGRPGTGKTTLITALIPELTRRGYRVASIKHSSHGFNLDEEGKDSWHYAQAGSECIVLSSPQKIVVTQHTDHDHSPAELVRFIPVDFDIILAEGYKKSAEPKIEVHRREIGEPVCGPLGIFALVTDEYFAFDVPQFAHSDMSGIADLIEHTFLAGRNDEEAHVFVDGTPVGLTTFVQTILSRTIGGMVASLKGVKKPATITVAIRKRRL